MPPKLSLILFMSSSFLLESLQAASLHQMDDMKTLIIPISEVGLTRLAVKGDRISGIYGINGEYTLEADEDLGQVFIRPNLTQVRGGTHGLHCDGEKWAEMTVWDDPWPVPDGPFGLGRKTVQAVPIQAVNGILDRRAVAHQPRNPAVAPDGIQPQTNNLNRGGQIQPPVQVYIDQVNALQEYNNFLQSIIQRWGRTITEVYVEDLQ